MSYELKTERLILTTSDKRMLPDILAFHIRNREHFLPWEDTKPVDYFTRKYHSFMIKSEKQALKRGDEVDFWIYRKLDGKLIGKVVLFGVTLGNVSNGVLGYKLDKDEQNSGYMHEALECVVNFAFDRLNLHRLEINIIPRNTRSVRVAQRLGFELEATSKEFMHINGKWEDHLRFVKINDNYKEQ